MNEIALDDILVVAHDIEFAQYDNSPEHTFSPGHIRAMKRIFKTYERNVSLLNHSIYKDQKQESHIRWNRKSLAVLLVLILLAVLAGCAVIIYTLGGFNTKSHSDNTELFPIDYENGPSIIENEYYLSTLPSEFVEIIKDRTNFYVYHCYQNIENDQTITLYQWVKSVYAGHENTEIGILGEIIINEKVGIYVDYANSKHEGCEILWDNGDYILEIVTSFSKDKTLDLAESAKILK